MYQYVFPHPIVVKLGGVEGLELRQKAAEYLATNPNTTGAERGSSEQQGFGVLAQIVVRQMLGMSALTPVDHPLGYDLLLPSGVKVDVKCRGGDLPFQEEYISSDGLPREAKHNLFARQLFDAHLDADVYLMTHLRTPSDGKLPGTRRQTTWILYVCGWVAKERAKREGVYLPRGSLSERGRTWFTYRGQELEYYNRNLNGLADMKDLLNVDADDVITDSAKSDDLNITRVDAVRMAYDLAGRGLLKKEQVAFVVEQMALGSTVKPILNANQYHHLLRWLRNRGQVTEAEIQTVRDVLPEEPYTGI